MGKIEQSFTKGKSIYVGIDVHKKDWTIHIVCEGEEIYHATLPPDTSRLISLLRRMEAKEVHTVYETGPTGYWLHEALIEVGFDSMVTPPSLVPKVSGKVKTDNRGSKKLAAMLAGGFLKRVYVLTPEELAHRQLVRTRNQIEKHRKQTQNQIKSLLLFHGKRSPSTLREKWTHNYLKWIETIQWEYEALKISMKTLLELFHHLDTQYKALTLEIEHMALTEKYRERVQLLTTIPGIGIFTAMAILVELQDIERFRRSDQLASYLGLTPSQRSSGERIRMGHITHCGNPRLRARFVESSWTLIRYDEGARKIYERIKHQTGSSKKAITAMARRLALRARRVLIYKKPYTLSDGGVSPSGRDKKREAKRLVLKRVITPKKIEQEMPDHGFAAASCV
jgi:transposase